MTKTQVKHKAQDLLMQAAQLAFSYADNEGLSDEEKEALIAETGKQFARIEGLFGYEKGSWSRGA